MTIRRLGTISRVHLVCLAVALATAALVARPSPAQSQPQRTMGGPGGPNLRAIVGRPLPDSGMPAGTVTVRVARGGPANGVGNAEVSAIVEAPGGDARKRTAKTDASGRATFESVPAGHRFRAEITVDGEKLSTDTFAIPPSGGIRTMLIAGLPPDTGAAGAETEAEADGDAAGAGAPGGRKPFSLGIVAAAARLDATLPNGVVDVLALDEQGRPLPNQKVELGRVAPNRDVDVTERTTGADGKARFADLPPLAAAGAGGASGGAAAAVVMDHAGLRLGTEGFQLPDVGGVSVEVRVPQTSADPSLISIGPDGRIILQLRDDGLGFIETLPLENRTDKLFDPGVGGIEIPLPSEAVGTEGAEGPHRIEVRKGIGVAVHGAIPPHRVPTTTGKPPDEVTFGFILPVRGGSLDFAQRFPNGLGPYTFITEQIPNLVIESPQITGRQDREVGAKKYWVMRGEAIPPGGTLRFTVRGLPAPDATGRWVSALLALGLVFASIVTGRRPANEQAAKEQSARDRLIQRREKLYGELVTLEGRRTTASPNNAAATAAPAPLKVERDELVRKLEGVYRELAALDEKRAA